MKKLRVVPLLVFCSFALVAPAQTMDSPTYPYFWALDRIEQQHLPLDNLMIPLDATGVTVYVVDTGINVNINNPDSKREFCIDPTSTDPSCPTRVRNGYTAQFRSDGSPIFGDLAGHGTAVASIIGGNYYGVTRNVNLVNVRVTAASQVIGGLDFILGDSTVPNALKVVNISELYPADSAIDQKVLDLIEAGITVVVGAGNGEEIGTANAHAVSACSAGSPARLGQPSYANNPEPYSTITVSASMLNQDLSQDARVEHTGAWFANDGPCVDIFAPGDLVDALGGKFAGTSAATPYVTGLVARLLVGNINNPHPKTPAQIEAIVKGLASRNLVANANVAPTPNRLLWLPTPSHHAPASHSDFNNDGFVDVVLHNSITGYAAVWLMSGTAYQTTLNLPGITNTDYRVAGAADFDNDGFPDLLWRNGATGNNAIWLMQGATLLSVVNLPALPLGFELAGTGDFNGDGHPDILVRNKDTTTTAVWLMNGTTYASTVNLPGLATKYELSGADDFNDDGKADILWRNTETGANAVWLMNGTTLSSILDLPDLPNLAYHIVAVADYNLDGQPDLVWRNPGTGANAIWLMNGGTYLQTVNLPSLTASGWEIKGPR